MGFFEAILLGITQGLTEFLPVSSSGHLLLLQRIFKISEPVLFFDTMLHLGTLVAVFVVLWKDIWSILRKPFQRLTWLLILGTLPTVIIALLFKDFFEAAFATGAYAGAGFLCTALLLTLSERLAARPGPKRGEGEMKVLDALVIGTLQGAAILPAVSRSGSTIAGALSRSLDRDFAARYSFLLAIPAILGATVLQLKDILELGTASAIGIIGWGPILAGTLSAALVGIFAVKFMLRMIRQRTMKGFALYVAILGILVLTDQFFLHLFF